MENNENTWGGLGLDNLHKARNTGPKNEWHRQLKLPINRLPGNTLSVCFSWLERLTYMDLPRRDHPLTNGVGLEHSQFGQMHFENTYVNRRRPTKAAQASPRVVSRTRILKMENNGPKDVSHPSFHQAQAGVGGRREWESDFICRDLSI